MNKRVLSRLEQGEGTTFLGKLFLTRHQRRTLLKWLLFSAVYLLLQVLQDVIFSRVRIFGGCPDLVPGYLLLVGLLQSPFAGSLFVLCAGVFRALAGAVLGPVSIVVLVFLGVFLGGLRRASLWGQIRSVILCTCLGIFIQQAVLFSLGLFLGSTSVQWLPASLGGCLGACVADAAMYPLARAIGKIGGDAWNG